MGRAKSGRSWPTFLLTALFLLTAISLASGASQPQTLEEAQRGWEEIQRSTDHFRGVAIETCEAVAGLPATESWKTRQEFAFSGESILYKFAVLEGEPVPESVQAINPDYAFNIKGDGEGKWSLRHVGGSERVQKQLTHTAQPLYISTIIDMEPLPWLVSQPGFKLKRISDVSTSEETLAKMEFESTAVFRPDYRITGGTITLDVERLWAVRDYSVNIQLDAPGTVVSRVEYDPANKTFPIPVRAVKDQKFTSAGVHRRYTIDYQSFEKAKTPESEFRLTAYGLPEPSGSGRLWQFVLIGGLVLIAAAGLIYVSRRRSAT